MFNRIREQQNQQTRKEKLNMWHPLRRLNSVINNLQASIQSLIIDMFKKAKIWAIREPQNVLHGLVPAEILKEYCDQHSIQEFIIPDIMTHDHPHRELSFQNFAFISYCQVLKSSRLLHYFRSVLFSYFSNDLYFSC